MGKKVVQILFPTGLTHRGKIYSQGEIELEPTAWLIECARDKIKQFHPDSSAWFRVCKFLKKREDNSFPIPNVEELDEDVVADKRKTVVEKFVHGGFDDDLVDREKFELVVIAHTLGLKKPFARTLNEDTLRQVITYLRKL
uniref:Uncharacterized protein n=1 Tax=viral metagenome TaxID=1070528 RepID=A0A6M3KTR6_9ZZZZ